MKKTYLKMVALGLVVISLTACGSNETVVESTNMYSLDIDGEPTYYDANNVDVVGVRESVEGFLGSGVAKDYKNPDTETEQTYYIKEIREANIANNVPERNKESMLANQIHITFDSGEVQKMMFGTIGGKETCLVDYVYISTFRHAIEEYMDRLNLKLDVPYRRTISLVMEKEEDGWKIAEYSLSKREEV